MQEQNEQTVTMNPEDVSKMIKDAQFYSFLDRYVAPFISSLLSFLATLLAWTILKKYFWQDFDFKLLINLFILIEVLKIGYKKR